MDPYQGDHITVCMAGARDGEGGGTESAQSEGRVKEREKEGPNRSPLFSWFFHVHLVCACLFVHALFCFLFSQPQELVSLHQQIKSDGLNCPLGKLVDFLDEQVRGWCDRALSFH